MKMIRLPTAVLVVISMVACVDNSGGPPPRGTEVGFEEALRLSTCRPVVSPGSAGILQSEAGVDAWLSGCDSADPATRADLIAAVEATGDDDVLVGVQMAWGGCVQRPAVTGVFLDDETLNIWALRPDTSYGKFQTSCTLDRISGDVYLHATDADFSNVTRAAFYAGEFNPNLPGGPLLSNE